MNAKRTVCAADIVTFLPAVTTAVAEGQRKVRQETVFEAYMLFVYGSGAGVLILHFDSSLLFPKI